MAHGGSSGDSVAPTEPSDRSPLHHFLNGQDIVEKPEVIIDRSGLTRLGQAGTAEDVQSAWKSFSSVRAEPVVRISDSLEEVSLALLDQTWRAMADRLELISSEGEFLLTVSGEGAFGLPWFRVRIDEAVAVSDLGTHTGQPDFITSSLDRSVSIAVSTEESDFWIIVAHADARSPRTSKASHVLERHRSGLGGGDAHSLPRSMNA